MATSCWDAQKCWMLARAKSANEKQTKMLLGSHLYKNWVDIWIYKKKISIQYLICIFKRDLSEFSLEKTIRVIRNDTDLPPRSSPRLYLWKFGIYPERVPSKHSRKGYYLKLSQKTQACSTVAVYFQKKADVSLLRYPQQQTFGWFTVQMHLWRSLVLVLPHPPLFIIAHHCCRQPKRDSLGTQSSQFSEAEMPQLVPGKGWLRKALI